MRRLFIEIEDATFARLQTLAAGQRRDVRDQAAIVIEQSVGRDDPRGRNDTVDGQVNNRRSEAVA